MQKLPARTCRATERRAGSRRMAPGDQVDDNLTAHKSLAQRILTIIIYVVLAPPILAHAFAAARGSVIAKCTNSLSSKPLGQNSKHDRHAVLTWPW